jgi:hypothetical protein
MNVCTKYWLQNDYICSLKELYEVYLAQIDVLWNWSYDRTTFRNFLLW